jgi:hypothetical protein
MQYGCTYIRAEVDTRKNDVRGRPESAGRGKKDSERRRSLQRILGMIAVGAVVRLMPCRRLEAILKTRGCGAVAARLARHNHYDVVKFGSEAPSNCSQPKGLLAIIACDQDARHYRLLDEDADLSMKLSRSRSPRFGVPE